MEFFLTTDELEQMTGYKIPRCQRRWLNDNGIDHKVNKFGRPVVIRAVLMQTMGIKRKREPAPDFEALEALNGR